MFLLQGIFWTQVLNTGLLLGKQILSHPSHQRSKNGICFFQKMQGRDGLKRENWQSEAKGALDDGLRTNGETQADGRDTGG